MADTILVNGRIHTLDSARPRVSALAIKDGLFEVTGSDEEIMRLRGKGTRVIDLDGQSVIRGLNDSHTHVIRGGLHYNMELRWEGVPSLADALRIAYNLFAQKPGSEFEDFQRWTGMVEPGAGDGMLRMNGAGENLAWSA